MTPKPSTNSICKTFLSGLNSPPFITIFFSFLFTCVIVGVACHRMAIHSPLSPTVSVSTWFTQRNESYAKLTKSSFFPVKVRSYRTYKALIPFYDLDLVIKELKALSTPLHPLLPPSPLYSCHSIFDSCMP